MPLDLATVAVLYALSLCAASLGSEIIGHFYRREPETLSYPAAVTVRSRWRVIILHWGLFLYMLLVTLLAQKLPPAESCVFIAERLCIGWALWLTVCTDFEQHVIFDRMLAPLAAVVFLFCLLNGAPVLRHIGAMLVGFGIFLVLAAVTKGGIGGGDIKLVALLGLWCGKKLFPVLVIGLILAGLAALVFLLAKRKRKRDFLAYGPYFAGAALYMMATP